MAAQPCDQSTPYTDRAARCPSHAADAPLDCFPLPQLERHLEAQGGTAGLVAGSVVPQMSEVCAVRCVLCCVCCVCCVRCAVRCAEHCVLCGVLCALCAVC